MSDATEEEMTRAFHEAMGCHGGWMPEHPTTDLPPGLAQERITYLKEEFGEYLEAVDAGTP